MNEPTSIDALMRSVPVIPVLVIEEVEYAEPIARALVEGGLTALEVTLRTPAALDVIRAMSRVDGAVVGAGTVLNERDLDAAIEAGATFIVSPGLTASLTDAALKHGIPYLPGVSNAADIMRGLDHGLDRFKFFPAEASGGIKALKALAAPFGQVRFCPTGGISEATAPEWLALSAVLCVGGSWVVKPEAPDLSEVVRAAKRASVINKILSKA